MIAELRRTHWRLSSLLVVLGSALAPVLLVVVLALSETPVTFSERLLVDLATESGLNFTAYALLAFSQTGMLLLAAYLFGETVAREVEWGTLGTVLTAPVDRAVVLLRKVAATAVVWAAATVVFTVSTVISGVVAFGAAPMTVRSGEPIELGSALLRLCGVVGYLLVANLWLVVFAVLVSVLADGNTLGAVGMAATAGLAFHLFGALPVLEGVRGVLPTRNYDAWRDLLHPELPATGMVWGIFLSLAYTVVFAVLALVVFSRRPIDS